MESTGSRSSYLYSPENRGLYFEVLEEFNKGNCLFSRNLMAYLENSHQQPGPFYQKHLSECEVCLSKVRSYKKLLTTVKAQIPYQQPVSDFESVIDAELKEAFSLFKQKVRKQKNKDSVLTKDFLSRVKNDLVWESIFTPQMLKGALYALLTGVLLSYIL